MTSARWRRLLWAGLLGCATLSSGALAEGRNPLRIKDAQYEPMAWTAIEGWAEDDHNAAFGSFLKSCKAILGGEPTKARPMYSALYRICEKAVALKVDKPGAARAFFEQNFRPTRIAPLGTTEGFFTGYYEPIAEGTSTQGGGYDHPLYRKPPNLSSGRMVVAAASGTGKKKIRKRRSVPFHDRAAIDDGILSGRDLEICWLRDPIDSFFAHIQGSVRVQLEDGKLLRLNYTAANGHPYYAVGRWLIDQGIIPKDEMSMDRIREWMERNPEAGRELRRRNKSYVFFRETRLPSNEEPVGAQGISLTPGRSIAVDRNLHVYGTPFFVSAHLPIESTRPDTWFRRLMIAQDTGGAIIGPARADLYFGAGDEAGSLSGRMRHNGRFVMLVPKELVPGRDDEDDDEIPLPRPRPELVAISTSETAPEPAAPAAAAPPPANAEVKPQPVAPAAKPVVAEPKNAKVAAKPADPTPDKPEKKAEKKAEKKKPEKTAAKPPASKPPASKPAAADKPAPSKLEAWEARVMPIIPPDQPAAKPKSKKRE